ncbi:hypothetical protein C8A03DRAFT_15017 [Achaetomium macrosporum]|uniref:C2H2-type domain-containing protein n=1 Tax=Achaetomium macrosporum TaxID=79813 RepID=A0AAN7HE92_9PEZI|nr:hypothetical protein C8A03DRAFT_15017 [Achaetomium macrosporum]
MVLATVLRGFKIPLIMLNRFLDVNGEAHIDNKYLSDDLSDFDDAAALLSTKLGHDTNIRIFIPHLEDHDESEYVYVAYAWVTAYAQRKIDMARELPDTPPPGFAELRHEILEEESLLQVEGCRGQEGEDISAALYVIVAEDTKFPVWKPFLRDSDLKCALCEQTVDDWHDLQDHRIVFHGYVETDALPHF